MGNLLLDLCDLIRSPKLKIGHHDPVKVNLDSVEIQGCILHTLPPRDVYYLCYSKID